MELIEGEDLSRRIARGAIPLDEALPIAKQVCGLEKSSGVQVLVMELVEGEDHVMGSWPSTRSEQVYSCT